MTLIPGWKKFEGRGVAIWLPDSFEGGNLDQDLDLVLEKLRGLGPDYEKMAQMVEQNKSVFVLWAFDSKVGNAGSVTSANITTEKIFSTTTIDTYLDSAEKQFPSGFNIVERDIVSLGGREAGRLVVELSISDVSGKEIVYTVKDGSNMWSIAYGTLKNEFEERLPVFEQSASTFYIQP